MPRALLILTLALLAAAPAAPAEAAALAKARLTACEPALDVQERSATFAADMRTIPGAARLQVKFVLQARTEDERRWAAVAAPGFGTWSSSETGIARYVYTKTVENLLAPAAYRSVVRFRWLSAAGRTLLRARRKTRVCGQPDLRPDLLVQEVARSGDGYDVVLENAGRTGADSFTLTIEVGGQVYPFAYVEHLGARERVRLHGQAPPCRAGSDVVVRVDADGAVDEADESANALWSACPL